jgi:hypothetical protein
MAHDNGSAGAPDLSYLAAEVASIRDQARGADARASEAIRRVAIVRDEHDADHRNVGEALAATQAQLGAMETQILGRLDALEERHAIRHAAVSTHLERIWGHLLTLETVDRKHGRDLTLLGVLVVVLCTLVRGGCA